LIPVPLLIIAFLLQLLVFKNDSVQYHVQHGEKDKAISMLEKIYPVEMYHVHEEIYNDFRKRGGFEQKDNEEVENVGIIDAFCHQDYRRGSWLVIFIVIAIQMNGVNLINIYTTTIFEAIKKEGGSSDLSAKT